MKTSDGSFHYCYNAQAVVDDANQVNRRHPPRQRRRRRPAFEEMLDQVIENCGQRQVRYSPTPVTSRATTSAAATRDIDPLIATGRLRHGEEVPAAPRGRIPKHATPTQRMARKLRTKAGKALMPGAR